MQRRLIAMLRCYVLDEIFRKDNRWRKKHSNFRLLTLLAFTWYLHVCSFHQLNYLSISRSFSVSTKKGSIRLNQYDLLSSRTTFTHFMHINYAGQMRDRKKWKNE